MKIALIADTHFGVRGDSEFFINYQEKYFTEHFFPELKKRKIRHVIHLGDLFDKRKAINSATFRRVRKFFFDPLKDFLEEMIVIAGNHDTYTDATNSINSLEMVIPEDLPIKCIIEPTEIDEYGIVAVPWITRENYHVSLEMIQNSKMPVLFGHLSLQGFEQYRGLLSTHGLSPTLFHRYDLVCSGHFHHKSRQGSIHYLGAPYQMIWNDADCSRGFHIYDTKSRKLEFVPNQDIIFLYAEYNDGLTTTIDGTGKIIRLRVNNMNDPDHFDRILKNLNDVAHRVDIIKKFEYDQSLIEEETFGGTVGADTLTLIQKSIDKIEASANTSKIKTYMSKIYNRALEIDKNI